MIRLTPMPWMSRRWFSNRNWQTDTISFLAEHQWRITDQWTTFLSYRTDKNTYSDWLQSPRATVVFTPTGQDTFKIMAGQSVRQSSAEELWAQWENTRSIPKPETLRSYELLTTASCRTSGA